MNRSLPSVFLLLLMLVSPPLISAQESGWPRTLPLEQGMVTIYSLQVDEMNDDIIHFRAALATGIPGLGIISTGTSSKAVPACSPCIHQGRHIVLL